MELERQQPLRVLYVITKANFGGAQRYVLDLARASRTKGYEVTIAYGEEGRLKAILEAESFRTIRIPALSRDVSIVSDIRAFGALLGLFISERPDVVHLNSSKIGALGGLAARIAFIRRIVFTAHGWAMTEDRPDWQKAIITLIHWWTVILSHVTVAVSDHTRGELARLPFMRGRIIVVHNAIPEPTFLSKEEARKKIVDIGGVPFAVEAFWIGMIAELHPNKGVDVAIKGFAEIAKQFPGSILVILGDGEKRDELGNLATEMGVSDRVRFVGFVPDAGNLLRAFDVLLFPSRKEGFPYAIIEAGLAGVPVVASAVGGIPEAIRDMESGVLIHPKNPQEVSRALTMIIGDAGRRLRMGERFREDVSQRFSFDVMTEKTFSSYTRNIKG